jgi:hypothetical protein
LFGQPAKRSSTDGTIPVLKAFTEDGTAQYQFMTMKLRISKQYNAFTEY